MKKRYYILAAITSYVFFTLGNIPAAKIIALAEDNVKMPARLYGIEGSVWNGSAKKVLIQNQPPIDNLQWSINPFSLFMARIGGELKANIKQQSVIGNLNINALGTISASDIRARIDAEIMQEILQIPLGELGGVFNINIESLEASPEGLPRINALIKWKNASLTLADTVDLGHVDLSIESDSNNQLVAIINNKQGQLNIDGKAIIDAQKVYSLELKLTPEHNAPDNIKQSLGMLARRQTDGSYQIKRKGNLRELGI